MIVVGQNLQGEGAISSELRRFILEVASRKDVHSVSCCYTDTELWRGLVGIQLERAELSGKPKQEAYCLCGPDSGLDNVPWEAWGGAVHIPCEGICDGDFLILPDYRKFYAESLGSSGKLNYAVKKKCNHLLVSRDFGDFENVTKVIIADKVLYSSQLPPKDCNPFH